jgi:hypothetical protein
MPTTDSRQGPGLLLIDALPIECQASTITLTPEHEEEDGTAVLCNPTPAPELVTSWKLTGVAIQDWELPALTGFVELARTKNGQQVPFEWTPNTAVGVKYSGTVQVRAVLIGGEVGKQNTTDFEFPVVGDLIRAEGAGGAVTVVTGGVI